MTTSLPGPYCPNHSTRSFSLSKNSVLSSGRQAVVIVTPHLQVPACASRLPLMISNRAVIALGLWLRNTTFSPFSMLKFTLSNSTVPSVSTAFKPSTSNIWLPGSRSMVKMMPGYLRLEGRISSTFSFSSIFLRLVVCLLFATLAEKRRMNSSSSLRFSSAFCRWFCA